MDFTAFQADSFDAYAFQIYSAEVEGLATLCMTSVERGLSCLAVGSVSRVDAIAAGQEVLYVG